MWASYSGQKIYKKIALIAFGVITLHRAQAHPTSYQGAIAVMTWNQPFLSDLWTTYSFRYDMAVAFRYMRMQMSDGRYDAFIPQLDYLLFRENGKSYQANIYVYGGGGALRLHETHRSNAWLGGSEADIESRSLFASLKGEWLHPASGLDLKQASIRLGVAPYEAEFNELASWLMVEAEYHPNLTRNISVTPLGRFFYKNVLWELGVSFDGDYMTNLMFHF